MITLLFKWQSGSFIAPINHILNYEVIACKLKVEQEKLFWMTEEVVNNFDDSIPFVLDLASKKQRAFMRVQFNLTAS